MFQSCETFSHGKFFRNEGFMFHENKMCVPNCSLRDLLVKESHGGGLTRHFGVAKTLVLLKDHFYWPHMKRDVERICGRCVIFKKAKSKLQLHGMYTICLFQQNRGLISLWILCWDCLELKTVEILSFWLLIDSLRW